MELNLTTIIDGLNDLMELLYNEDIKVLTIYEIFLFDQ